MSGAKSRKFIQHTLQDYTHSDYQNTNELIDNALKQTQNTNSNNLHVMYAKGPARSIELESNISKQKSANKKIMKNNQNKQNKRQFDLQDIRSMTYTNLSKTLEEKSSIINQQKQQIESLKRCVEDIKYNKEFKQKQEEKIKNQELTKLKLQEKEYLDNLKQIQCLKLSLKEIRKRYEQMLNEKNCLNLKYNALLNENEQLTIIITNIKMEKQLTSTDNQLIELEQSNSLLKQQLRKEQTLRQSIEERCGNFEKRMTEQINKYYEVQESYNQSQVRYYKLQRENDNLKLDSEEFEQKYVNLQKQLKTEKEINQQEALQLKNKLKRHEQLINEQQSLIITFRQAQNIRNSFAQENTKLKAQMQRIQEQIHKLHESLKSEITKCQKYVKQSSNLNQQIQELVTKVYQYESENIKLFQLNQRYQIASIQNDRNIADWHSKYANLSEKLDQSQHKVKIMTGQIAQNEKIKYKCDELISQNQRIMKHFTRLIEEKQGNIQGLESLVQKLKVQLEEKSRQESKILLKINQLECNLTEGNEYLNEKNMILSSENNSLTEILTITRQKLDNYIVENEKQQKKQREQTCHYQSQIDKRQKSIFRLISEKQHQYELYMQARQKEDHEKRYYQQKYEQQLQEYNELSKHFNQSELENARLMKNNTVNLIEISTLKADLIILRSDLSKFIRQEDILEDQRQNHLQARQKIAKQLSVIHSKDLLQKQKSIQSLKEEIVSLKNLFLLETQKNNELRTRLNDNESEMKSQEMTFTSQINSLHQKLQSKTNIQIHYSKMSQQKQNIIQKIRKQLQAQVMQIHSLNENISLIEHKYYNLIHQYNKDSQKWTQLQKQWAQLKQSNDRERKLMKNSTMSASIQLDSNQTTIDILRKENEEFQRIFGQEIQKRNGIIRQLIKQKKCLYDQLMDRI